MKFQTYTNIWLLFSFLIICNLPIAVNSIEELGDIIPITNSSFDEDLKENPFMFILFHKMTSNADLEKFGIMFKEFKEVYNYYRNKNDGDAKEVSFAIVDSANFPEVAERCGITEFPVFKLFIDGSAVNYPAGNYAEDIKYFLKTKLQPVSAEFYIPEDLEKFLANKEVLVFFGEPTKDNPKFRQFLQVARNHEDVLFAHCGMYECIQYYKIDWNEMIFFKKQHKQSFELKDPWTDYMITRLIETHQTRLMPAFDKWVADFIFVRLNVGLFLFRDQSNPSHLKYELISKRVSKYFKGFIHFAIVDINNELEKELAQITKVTKQNMPCVYIYDARMEHILTYKMEEEITEETLLNFAIKFGSKELQPFYASEELVEEQKQNYPVRTLVGKSFRKEVFDDTENYVFIFIYGDECNYCHKAGLLFDKSANILLEKNNKIKFFKLNGDLNEIPGIEIVGYPFMKLFYPNNRIISYDYPIDQDRSIKRIAEFLKDNISSLDVSNINNKLDDDFEVHYEELFDNTSETNLHKEEM